MAYLVPSIQDFKNQFYRDFPYGTDPAVSVLDIDISNAINFAAYQVNQELFSDQTSFSIGYLLMTAHQMVLNLRASSQGLNGQYNWAQTQKAAAGVSESFQLPQRIIDNPELMMLTKTNYGAQYLQMILPLLTGQMFAVCGTTRP